MQWLIDIIFWWYLAGWLSIYFYGTYISRIYLDDVVFAIVLAPLALAASSIEAVGQSRKILWERKDG